MNEGIITARYAKALYQAGEEEKKLSAFKENIELLQTILEESEEFSTLIHSPTIKVSDKIRLFESILSGKVEPIIFNFLQLLVKNKREMHLPSICRYFIHTYKQKHGIKAGSITTSKPLDDKHREEVFNFIKKKFKIDIDLSEKVDPSIIGGFKLCIEDQQIDASISSKLNKIRNDIYICFGFILSQILLIKENPETGVFRPPCLGAVSDPEWI